MSTNKPAIVVSETGTDYAILVMAVHRALQVFEPFTEAVPDGLYLCRSDMYAGACFIPSFMAGLAYVNS